MKYKIAMAAVVVLLAWAGMTFSRAAAPAGAVPTKWEYRCIFHGTAAVDDLGQCNTLGAEGWELVSVIDRGSETWYYFKRSK